MNQAHWHLMLNHIPITGAAFALIAWLYAIWRNHADIYRFALGWAIVVGLLTLPVYWSDEQGHKLLHGLADFSHEMAETHEVWGIFLLYAMLTTSALAAVCFWRLKRTSGLPSPVGRTVMLPTFLITTGLGIYTGHLGGMVHHPAMRPDFAPQAERS